MVATSRTAKSVKNSAVALGFYFINLVLQFFSRKVFLDHLGAEVLGLNTTATNLLQFLNLAELGIGTAIACTLYKPLFDKDTTAINEIVSLQGWMYRRIAWVVIAGSTVLMAFFPWIFAKMPLPLWYAYASFAVLLVSALLSYFVNYKQIVLSADQQEYKIQYSYKAAILVKTLFQIFAIKYFDNGYVWWLVLEVVFAVIASVALDWMVRRTYPYLETSISLGRRLSRKYPDIITKIKQIFVHKINGFAVSQLTSLVIYAFASLSLVAYYSNYMLIVGGIGALFGAVFNGIGASIGNLVVEKETNQVEQIFNQLFSFRFLLISTLCFSVYTLSTPFITIWVGSAYLLDSTAVWFIVLTMFVGMGRSLAEQFLAAYNMFFDVWAAISEACLIMILSIIGGYFWNLHGILGGGFIGMTVFVLLWKPYFLFTKGFKRNVWRYYKMYALHLAMAAIAWGVSCYILSILSFDSESSVFEFIVSCILYPLIYGFLLFCLLYIMVDDMRILVRRILHFRGI